MITFFLRNPWAQVAAVLLVVAMLCYFGVAAIQNSGRRIERAETQVATAKQETRAAEENRGLAEDGTRRVDQFVERTRNTKLEVSRAVEGLAHAEDLESVGARYADSVRVLRDDAARARAEAVDDYNRSIAAD